MTDAPQRSPAEEGYELITRRICLIKDTGHAGTLWGGAMMSWIDEAGAIYAGSKAWNTTLVTKAFTELIFTHAVRPGDFVEFWGRVEKYGHTSISVHLKVCASRPSLEHYWEVLDVTGVFVAVDERGEKTRIVPRSTTERPQSDPVDERGEKTGIVPRSTTERP